jgi:hypothetical protein
MGMGLFAVMVEVDGAGTLSFILNRKSVLCFGIPLAYCFVDVFEDDRKGKRNAEPGAMIDILCNLFGTLD